MDMVTPRRFDVFLVSLDPTVGAEMRKTRPCVIVSPDEANRHMRTAVVVPLTSTLRSFPSRVPVRFRGRDGQLAIDHIRAVDCTRLARRIGAIKPDEGHRLAAVIRTYFG
ncbi:MAG: type II toxin-antitoxin system PemK/MazF family toxin [Rhizomicrobium sp.]